MKIAVTGGTGYVGAHTALALLADGHTVRLLVLPTETPDALLAAAGAEAARIEPVVGDIRDAETVARLLDGCDALLHAAGVVGTDDRREQLMWEINTQATAAILTRAAFLGLDPIVHVASFSARLTHLSPGLGYEAAWLLTSATPTDDSRTRDELGLTWRPARAALAATFA
ncbi:NAD-dependent epimerase/dehydratase family protein [Rhodococcus koreensis]|uniref:NAD-dependent epimerase/dehydratase family protein n=1 Tax=Rhodococcus koreensis TaxID=99653 RepID=UPI0036DBE379